ncbi:hypothetical protein KP509_34G032800 [Ceratopteris richardii]|uniref:Uncharacterized protein n=2 Tax=Ceratopteris richardii TaxID=49495 RepID=A0A8T2QK27_CERRI|nr:hypothetical protein KP509_34G032800 [Ceratopteris richardii]
MPSGSKKRKNKASKKPKPNEPSPSPQIGDPPESEKALEAPMENDEGETIETSPLNDTDEAVEAIGGEEVLDVKELMEETSERGSDENELQEESVPKPDECDGADPLSEPEEKPDNLEPEVTGENEPEATVVSDAAQGDLSHHVEEDLNEPPVKVEPEEGSPAPPEDLDAEAAPVKLECGTDSEDAVLEVPDLNLNESLLEKELETEEPAVEEKEMSDVVQENAERGMEDEASIDDEAKGDSDDINPELKDDKEEVEADEDSNTITAEPESESGKYGLVDHAETSPVADPTGFDSYSPDDQAAEETDKDAVPASVEPELEDHVLTDDPPVDMDPVDEEMAASTKDTLPDTLEATDADASTPEGEMVVGDGLQVEENDALSSLVQAETDVDEAVQGHELDTTCNDIEQEVTETNVDNDDSIAAAEPVDETELDSQPNEDEDVLITEPQTDGSLIGIEFENTEDSPVQTAADVTEDLGDVKAQTDEADVETLPETDIPVDTASEITEDLCTLQAEIDEALAQMTSEKEEALDNLELETTVTTDAAEREDECESQSVTQNDEDSNEKELEAEINVGEMESEIGAGEDDDLAMTESAEDAKLLGEIVLESNAIQGEQLEVQPDDELSPEEDAATVSVEPDEETGDVYDPVVTLTDSLEEIEQESIKPGEIDLESEAKTGPVCEEEKIEEAVNNSSAEIPELSDPSECVNSGAEALSSFVPEGEVPPLDEQISDKIDPSEDDPSEAALTDAGIAACTIKENEEETLEVEEAAEKKDSFLFQNEIAEIEGEPKALVTAERDVGEDEAASSTVAEVGSVINDFDENLSYQHLPGDSLSSEQDEDTMWSKSDDFSGTELMDQADDGESGGNDIPPLKVSEIIDTGLAQGDDAREDNVVGAECSPVQEVGSNASQDFEATPENGEILHASPIAGAAFIPSAFNGESTLPVKEAFISENAVENGQVGILYSTISAAQSSTTIETEVTEKVSPRNSVGQPSLLDQEVPDHETVVSGKETGLNDNASTNADEADIHVARSNEFTGADSSQLLKKDSEVNTQERSPPMVNERALEKVNMKGAAEKVNMKVNERSVPSTLQRRNNWLGCCGMFDVLLGGRN